jgi:hypothetical protein
VIAPSEAHGGHEGGDLFCGSFAAGMPVAGQHAGIRLARDDVAKDRDPPWTPVTSLITLWS